MGPTRRLAIDLGTCHTVAVVQRGNEAPRPLLVDGSPLMTSGVYADESGALSVGRDAERLAQLAPSRFEPYPKRRVDEGSVLLGEAEMTVVDLLAALLRRVAAESLQAGVNPVGATGLTCPADGGGPRRGVLRAAARAANLGPVELVDEPIAAATYCVRVLGHQIQPLQSLAVFDFGGGTLDVSVVRRDFDGLKVLAVGGLDDLGGVDVDAALVGHLGQLIELRTPELWRRLAQPEGAGAQRDRRALWNEVKAAKEMLSRASSAPVHVPGTEEALHLTREELDRVAGPLVDRAVDETRRVLERAGVGTGQLAGIFLVGGSSRIPLVASRLHTRFGIAPTVPEQPELPVAYGGLLAVAARQVAPPAGFPPPQHPVSGSPVSPGGYPTSTGQPVSGGFAMPTSPAGSYPPGPPTFPPTSPTSTFPPGAPVSPGSPVAPGSPAPPGTVGAPGMPGPPGMTGAPRPPFVAKAAHVPMKKRRGAGRYIAVAVVVALLAACGFGVRGAYRWVTGAFGDATRGIENAGAPGGGDGGAQITGLKGGTAIDLPAEGAVAAEAGAGLVFTASVKDGKTEVTGHATTGDRKWVTSVSMEPAELQLKVVGNLLLVDGGRDTTRGEQDSRAVLDAGSGALKWVKPWDNRVDLLYIGTDAVVEVRASPSALGRFDLNTGEARWQRPGEKTFFINGQRRAKPALGWPKADVKLVAGVPSYTESFSALIPFQESTGADPTVAVHLEADSKASVINLDTGAVKVTGTVPGGRNGLWTVYAGTAVFKPDSGGDNTLVGFSLTTMARIWEFKKPANADIDDMRPCGERLLCVKSNVSLKYTIDAVDMTTGQSKWSKPVEDEPNWYVLDGRLVLGEGGFTSVDEASVVDPATGNKLHDVGKGVQNPMVYAGSGNRMALMNLRLAGGRDPVWQVSVANVADGKVLGSADIGKDIVQYIRISADTVVVLDEKTRKVFRFTVPASG